jgi:hypothetical protein
LDNIFTYFDKLQVVLVSAGSKQVLLGDCHVGFVCHFILDMGYGFVCVILFFGLNPFFPLGELRMLLVELPDNFLGVKLEACVFIRGVNMCRGFAI